MAAIQFSPSVTWETLPQMQVSCLVDQGRLLEKLAVMRVEWEEATNGQMTDVRVDMVAFFDDLVRIVQEG